MTNLQAIIICKSKITFSADCSQSETRNAIRKLKTQISIIGLLWKM